MAYVTYARQCLEYRPIVWGYYVLVLACIAVSCYYALVEHVHLQKEAVTSSGVALYVSNPDWEEEEEMRDPSLPRCGRPSGRLEPRGSAPPSECVTQDAMESTRPHAGALLLTTHVLENLQLRACSPSDVNCSAARVWRNVRAAESNPVAGPGCLQRSYFVAGAEHLHVAIEHHLHSHQDPSISWGVRDMHGSFLDQHGAEILAFGPGHRDSLPLSALLAAAGLAGLDELSTSHRVLEPCGLWQARHPESCCEDFGPSVRARGLYLEVDVKYANLALGQLLPLRKPFYQIRVRHVPHAEAYVAEVSPGCGAFEHTAACAGGSGRHRISRLLAGVQVSVRATGFIGHLAWSKLLLWLLGLSTAMTTAWNVCEGFIEFFPPTKQELYKEQAGEPESTKKER